jgi:ribosomal protein S18 acetylase RimI-like enzyme
MLNFQQLVSRATPQPATTSVRWMLKRDLPIVCGIEQATFDNPASEYQLIEELRSNRTALGTVVEVDGRVLGYAILYLHGPRISIGRIAVHHNYRDCGLGTALVNDVKRRVLKRSHRTHIRLVCPLECWEAAEFFGAQGFICASCENDVLEFVWRKGWE